MHIQAGQAILYVHQDQVVHQCQAGQDHHHHLRNLFHPGGQADQASYRALDLLAHLCVPADRPSLADQVILGYLQKYTQYHLFSLTDDMLILLPVPE